METNESAFGHFDEDRREYVITNPLTPVRWINYLGDLSFGGFVDQQGGLLLCKGDPAENRITKYIPQLPGGDMNGAAFYLRIRDGGRASGGPTYRVVSPFYTPCRTTPTSFEARVGLGYSTIRSQTEGLVLEVTFFVPSDHPVLIMDAKISNVGSEEISVDFVPVIEYSHFQALKQFTNADWVPQTMQSQALEVDGARCLIQYAFMNRDERWNFLHTNSTVSSWETNRSMFLGGRGYGSWANPLSLQSAALPCTEALRGDNIAALLHALGIVEPGDHRRVILQIGQCGAGDVMLSEHVARYSAPEAVDDARTALHAWWTEYLATMTVHTPSPAMNAMLNVHHPRQCMVTKNWSRYLSSYQLGLGARGLGYRDSCQDLLGVAGHDPDGARELLEKILAVQRPDGSAMHQFNPLTGIANEGDSREQADRPNWYGDDHLWAILAGAFYVGETGDRAFLDTEVPYYAGTTAGPVEGGTVRDHFMRALNFTWTHLGEHGLPLLGFADWNDAVNLPVGAESVFVACLYGWALREMAKLMEWMGDREAAAWCEERWQEMGDALNAGAWDGEWYLRYFDDRGAALGSASNDRAKIFVNAQSWPVLAGFADELRAVTALDAVAEKLDTRYGIKVSWPGYDGYDPHVGGISTYPPGAKENGGIFLHTNPWVMIAETLIGRGDRAFDCYNRINPASRDPELYECEPYCYAQNILGDDHPLFGLARNSWLSGTAAWTYVAATRYILGIRPGIEGLQIDPVIPSGWSGFTVTRRFRGATYNIQVDNPEGRNRGVISCLVDGAVADAGKLPLLEPGTSATVRVTMG